MSCAMPIVIEPGTGAKAFGVIVPDLPGGFSAGDRPERRSAFCRFASCIECGLLYQPVEIATARFGEETSELSSEPGPVQTAPGDAVLPSRQLSPPYQYGWSVHSGECQWIVLSSKRNCVVTAIGL